MFFGFYSKTDTLLKINLFYYFKKASTMIAFKFIVIKLTKALHQFLFLLVAGEFLISTIIPPSFSYSSSQILNKFFIRLTIPKKLSCPIFSVPRAIYLINQKTTHLVKELYLHFYFKKNSRE